MGVEGIGARVVRKEDKRFITGKGRYVDDIKLQGMTHAHFIRSPHAHAKVKKIDSSAALNMPGCTLYVSGTMLFPLQSQAGSATWTLPICACPELAGSITHGASRGRHRGTRARCRGIERHVARGHRGVHRGDGRAASTRHGEPEEQQRSHSE